MKETDFNLSDLDELIGLEPQDDAAIAVIGMAARIADMESVDELWQALCNGECHIRPFPQERKEKIADYLRAFGKNDPHFENRAYLENIDEFDAALFRVTPKDAERMDPAQRLFSQIAWQAIEDGGYSVKSLDGTKTGVFVGFSSDTDCYANYLQTVAPKEAAKALAGTVNSVIAARISYLLNLHGPAMLVDTACSSSLVAVHLACESLRRGECSMALAGGVKLMIAPDMQDGGEVTVASSDGITRTFDEASEGTGGGEGVAAVLLKPYAEAVNDGDRIYAVIKGSSINQDGRSVGITAPNTEAQRDMLIEAWDRANLPPETAGYIEAHGTATRLGDSIEIDALTKAFGAYTDKRQFCAVGSAKTNVGHLDCAAGILGFIKAVKVAQTGLIPPSLHFNSPNRQLDFASSPLYVNDRLSSWKGSEPRRVGVSSFGMSGTNCHVVIEQGQEESRSVQSAPCVLTLSAISEAALRRMIRRYCEFFEASGEPLQDICYTSNVSRGEHKLRAAFLLQKKEDFRELAEQALRKDSCTGAYGGQTELMRQYLEGGEADWQSTAYADAARKVSLPGYPFEKTAYWVRAQKKAPPVVHKQLAHPLLDRILVDTPDCRVYESRMSAEATMELREHKLGGRSTLAGTVYIELIRAAMEPLLGSEKMELCDLVFLAPLTCEEACTVQTVIVKKDGQWQLRVQSLDEDSNRSIPHLETTVRPLLDAPSAPALAQLQAEFAPYLQKNYVANNDDFIQIGPHWNLPIEVYVKGPRVLSHVWAPQEMKTVLDGYGIYPALFDGSIHACNVLNQTGFCLPFCFNSLRLYGKTTMHSYGLMEKLSGAEGVNTYDGTLYNERGEVVAQLRRYSMRSVEQSEDAIFGKQRDNAMHRIVWETAQPLPDLRTGEEVLILLHPAQAAHPLYRRFPSAVASTQEELTAALERYPSVQRIVFMHGLRPDTDLTDVQMLFDLCRCLESDRSRRCELSVLTANAYSVLPDETTVPRARLLSAMVQALPAECDRLQVSCMDVDLQTEDLGQLLRRRHSHVTAAYRAGRCYVPRLEPFRPQKNKPLSFTDSGVYLITGGLGGMGQVIAQAILRLQPKANIAVLTRRSLSEEERHVFSGQVLTCDVTDRVALEQCVAHLRRSYGRISGVFHAAGIAGGGIYLRRNWADFESTLAPKVTGTDNLYAALKDAPPDFMLLFSSYASVLYPMGQADYVAANAYLDAFSAIAPWVQTVNWTGWSETGMAVKHGAQQSENAVHSLTNEQATELLWQAMASDTPQILLGRWNEERFDHALYAPFYLLPTEVKTLEQSNQTMQIQLSGKLNGEPTQTELQVAQAWSKVLGLTELDYHAKFLEVGGDSITAAALQKELGQTYPGVLDITDVFVYPSIGEMAGYIDEACGKSSQANPSSSQDETMALLEKLSSGDIDLEEAMSLIGG